MPWDILNQIGPWIPGVVALYIAIKKTPHEAKSLDGDAANKFATAAGLTADENIELRKNMREMEDRMTTQINAVKAENAELRKEITAVRKENKDLREWAECLCGQVKELGGRPVLLRSKT